MGERTKVMIMKRNLMRGQDKNKKDKEDIPISPKLMKLSTKYTYTSKGPYPCVEKVNKTARKKMS